MYSDWKITSIKKNQIQKYLKDFKNFYKTMLMSKKKWYLQLQMILKVIQGDNWGSNLYNVAEVPFTKT